MATTAATAKPATRHYSVILPLYEVKYNGAVLQTDPKVLWIDTSLAVGDTLKLSDPNLRLDKATLSYGEGSDIFELDVSGNIITKKFKEMLQTAYTDKGERLYLDIINCIDRNGKPVKSECSYRLKFY
jgi:hypothetical protein